MDMYMGRIEIAMKDFKINYLKIQIVQKIVLLYNIDRFDVIFLFYIKYLIFPYGICIFKQFI